MICKVCGSEFNIENFDVCPYCMTPIEQQTDVYSDVSNEMICDEICNEIHMSRNDCNEENDLIIDDLSLLGDEMEITDADLIEDKEISEDINIEDLGLSVRALNAFRRVHIHTLHELIDFLATNDISDIKNVGAKTVRETEELMKKFGAGALDFTNRMKKSEFYLFENISPDVDYLSINALSELGFSSSVIAKLVKNGIRCCGELRTKSMKDMKTIIGSRFEEKITLLAGYLEMDIIALTTHVLDKNKERREFNAFLRRAKGETLQEIADNPQGEGEQVVTRERVRQLERSQLNSIIHYVKELIYICKGGDKFISIQDLLEIFDDDDYDQVLLYACKLIDEFEYLDFADVIIERAKEGSIENMIFSIIRDIVGNGIDLSLYVNDIEEALLEKGIDYIGIDAIKNLLKKNNYYFYGDFVTKGKGSYATICMYIIKHYFPNGIKLSQSENEQSDDLRKIREIVEENYGGIELPKSDRAISSTLSRSGLVLRGRGQYILEEQVIVDETVMADIKEYIDKSELSKVFYKEIYAEFEGVLNMVCGVDNHNYLHGILALRFPDEYEYNKDYLLKNGVSNRKAESIPDRIYGYICRMGRPVSKSELEQEFRGFSNVMITNSIANDSRLFQWDYNYFSCTGILNVTFEGITKIEKILEAIFDEYRGYASDNLLYSRVYNEYPEIIEQNDIKSEMNLHYVVACLLGDKIDFKRPHICRKGDVDISSTKNVILYLLNYPEKFTYEQYKELVLNMGWSHVTASFILYELEEDYARVSVDTYILKDKLIVTDDLINRVKQLVLTKMEDGILPIANLDFEDFPDWMYEWNEFILETIVVKYLEGIDIIQPIMKDRRYQKGILVNANKGITSYPQVVANKMRQCGYEKMSESQFFSFLVVNNLTRKAIPNELSNNDYIKKEGDSYCVIK